MIQPTKLFCRSGSFGIGSPLHQHDRLGGAKKMGGSIEEIGILNIVNMGVSRIKMGG